MNQYFFLPANEADPTVYGAECPGYGKYDQTAIEQWNLFMRGRCIDAVVCLLPQNQLVFYQGSLLDSYAKAFGCVNVLHEPIKEMHFCTKAALCKILEFLADRHGKGQRTVVHCLAGSGRTGHVLAAWLVYNYGLSSDEAIDRMRIQGREPFEATIKGYGGNEEKTTLDGLLSMAAQWRSKRV